MKKQLPLSRIKRYVKRYFAEHHHPGLCFHTYDRVKSVVRSAKKIAKHYELPGSDYYSLMAAAWFHSIGYMIDKNDPQSAAAEQALKYLASKKVRALDAVKVSDIILAPVDTDDSGDLTVRILIDAIYFYLGSRSFQKKIELQRKEEEWLSGMPINKADWMSGSYEWVANYKFHTMYTLQNIKPAVDRNLTRLREELAGHLVIYDELSVGIHDVKNND